jgi:hypothetical protein
MCSLSFRVSPMSLPQVVSMELISHHRPCLTEGEVPVEQPCYLGHLLTDFVGVSFWHPDPHKVRESRENGPVNIDWSGQRADILANCIEIAAIHIMLSC